jgi:hypothetical protein
MLPKISDEQRNIIVALKRGKNVKVNAVAGSGKTTTCLHIARKFKSKDICLLTYNSALKIETRIKKHDNQMNNLEVNTFHSFCIRYYGNNDFTDKNISITVEDKKAPIRNISFDIIIIDEAQDLIELYYNFFVKLYKDNNKKAHICVIGDIHQTIYQYKGADSRFLEFADKIIKLNDYEWESCKLTKSFRVPSKISSFINECMLKNDYIKSHNESHIRPKYVITNTYQPTVILNIIEYYLKNGYEPKDFFIISPSINSNNTLPVIKLENEIKKKLNNVKIYVPMSNEEKANKQILQDKLVISTIHQTKGLERKIVILYSFDSSYFKYYAKNYPKCICSNELYVASTRALEILILVHDYRNDYLPFLEKDTIDKHCQLVIHEQLNIREIDRIKAITLSVTKLTDFVDSNMLESMVSKLKIIPIFESNKPLILTGISKQSENNKEHYENVYDLTGIAIPAYFEYTKRKKMEINVNNINPVNSENILKIANSWNHFNSGYLFKLKQITNYNWLSQETLNECVQNMDKLKIKKTSYFEKELIYQHLFVNKTLNVIGRADCVSITAKLLKIYEFKVAKVLAPEYYLQLAFYMYISSFLYPGKTIKGYLYNIYEDNLYELVFDKNVIEILFNQLINSKISARISIPDEKFLGIFLRK